MDKIIHTPDKEPDKAQVVKLLTDCLFLSFQYSRGGKSTQELIFKYLAVKLVNEQQLTITSEMFKDIKVFLNDPKIMVN